MTDPLYIQDSYAKNAIGTVIDITPDNGIVLDQTIFYATSGGQPGDQGRLVWAGTETTIETTIKGDGGISILMPKAGDAIPSVGDKVEQYIDWDLRYAHMRMHTALHLLSVVIPLPVTGGSITASKGRLDFDMPDAPEDKDALTATLNALITQDHAVSDLWITDAELDANPGLVKTMSVSPPKAAGRVRLVRIGNDTDQVDLQPCGGTHVRKTGEIGAVVIGKIEKKGKQNRRVNLFFAES